MLQNKNTVFFFLILCFFSLNLKAQTYCDRIGGMILASAIADAMGGPHEGRSREISQQFIVEGNWIDDFSQYNPWFQHHWNCYPAIAPAGMFTDDNRMRLSTAQFMIDHATVSKRPMTREELAAYIFEQYRSAYQEFELWDKKYKQADTKEDSSNINVLRKEKFLAMWYAYELAKTATSVFVPQNPGLYTPAYIRVSEHENHAEYFPEWHLEPQPIALISSDIKYQYHFNTYEKGLEMPLGLIHLLPLAAYFPGQPQQAFEYILEVDFFDIKKAPYYPATAVALIAELLGEKAWRLTSDRILKEGLSGIVLRSDSVISGLNAGIQKAILIARKHQGEHTNNYKQNILFIVQLHDEFGQDPDFMCSNQEMLFVAIALLEFGQDDVNFLIELGVNYGRDNDTVGSIAATMGGALHGLSALNVSHVEKIKKVNSGYNMDKIISDLCKLSQ